VHQLADARQRLMRLQAVGTGLFTGEGDLLLQAGDADFEELVQVAGEDQQELQPLQQRVGLIQRLFQHADVELQLRQLAVDVQAAVIQAGIAIAGAAAAATATTGAAGSSSGGVSAICSTTG
jgi:hypothetical protein